MAIGNFCCCCLKDCEPVAESEDNRRESSLPDHTETQYDAVLEIPQNFQRNSSPLGPPVKRDHGIAIAGDDADTRGQTTSTIEKSAVEDMDPSLPTATSALKESQLPYFQTNSNEAVTNEYVATIETLLPAVQALLAESTASSFIEAVTLMTTKDRRFGLLVGPLKILLFRLARAADWKNISYLEDQCRH